MCKNVCKNIKTFLSKQNWTIITSIATVILLTVGVASLIVATMALRYTAEQIDIARSELEVARSDLEAKTRPYLSVENIEVKDRGDEWISIIVGVVNRGELPAVSVGISEIVMGGESITWTSEISQDFPAETYTTEDGVTITIGGMVIAPYGSNFPQDMIFFPNKYTALEFPSHSPTWRSTIVEGSVMEVGMRYSWGEKDYWYVATAMLQSNGEWIVSLERGN